MTRFQKLRKHLTPSTAIAFIALVFALTGGAFAATGGDRGSGGPSHATLTATTAKSKGKTGPRGPRGPAGPAGKNGAAGPAGPTGPAGAPGAKGETGAAGAAGAQGKEGAPGKEGKEGEEGTPGTEGSPWTAGGTLPSGSTETGTWSARFEGVTHVKMPSSISFPIPLKEALVGEGPVHYVTTAEWKEENGEKEPAACEGEPAKGVKVKGTAEDPQAEKGNLCIYQGRTVEPSENTIKHEVTTKLRVTTVALPASGPGSLSEGVPGVGTAGATLLSEYRGPTDLEEEVEPGVIAKTPTVAELSGSWAVTAP